MPKRPGEDIPPLLRAPDPGAALPPPNDPYTPSLAAKLAQIMGEASYLQKKGRNTQQNYSYAAEADYLDLIKPMLAARKIAFLPTFSIERVDMGATKSGTPTFSVMVVCLVQFIDGETGEVLAAQSIGQGIDTQDKAPYKAMTGAVKYLLSKTFLIPTGDDPEVDVPPEPAPVKTEPKPIDSTKFRDFIKEQFIRLGNDTFNEIVKACGFDSNAVFDLPDVSKRTLAKRLREATVPET